MKKNVLRAAVLFFMLMLLLATDLAAYPEPVGVQDSNSSLQDTLNWIKDQLDRDAIITHKRNDAQIIYTSKIAVVDGCRMEIQNDFQKRSFPDRKPQSGTEKLGFQLRDLDPVSIKISKLSPGMTGFTIDIFTVDKKNAVTADLVKLNGEPEIYALDQVTIVLNSRSKKIAERVGQAFAQAIRLCKQ
ncbi:MAG: hypothetical protein V7641_852 [Blastocatellia bacterium]